MSESEQPKIIVDDDWKAQAQAEKEKLASEQTEAPKPGERPELPEASFSTLITTMASQILFSLGAVPDPQTQKRYVDLDLAKFHIDTLKVLEDKTAGNLSEEEKKLLDTTLYELRSQFIAISQHVKA